MICDDDDNNNNNSNNNHHHQRLYHLFSDTFSLEDLIIYMDFYLFSTGARSKEISKF